MKRTGIILELNQKKAIVMTNEAEFITIKRETEMYIGAPVEFNQKTAAVDRKTPVLGKRLQGAAIAGLTLAAALVLSFTFFFNINSYKNTNPFAYVTVDINPSVEFSLSPKLIVTQASDLNADGYSLLAGTDFINMPLDQALLSLTNLAEQRDYFKNSTERHILVSAVSNQNNKGNPELLEQTIRQCQMKLAQSKIQLQYIPATFAQRKSALENHLSTGRYALMNYAEGAGRTMDLEMAKNGAIRSLLNEAGLLTDSSDSSDSKNPLNPLNPLNAPKPKTDISEASAPGNPELRPTNPPTSGNTPDRIAGSDQLIQGEPTPTLPYSFNDKGDSIPTLSPDAGMTAAPEPHTESAVDNRLAVAISSAYTINVTGQDIAALRIDAKLGYGEIGFLYGLANASGKTITDLLTLRQGDMGWSEIAKSLGLRVTDIIRKNSSVLKAAKLSNEDQKLKALLKDEEKENNGDKPKPTKKVAPENKNTNTNSSSRNNPGNGNPGNGKKK